MPKYGKDLILILKSQNLDLWMIYKKMLKNLKKKSYAWKIFSVAIEIIWFKINKQHYFVLLIK